MSRARPSGFSPGRFAAAELRGRRAAPPPPPRRWARSLAHITGGADAETFQPMNINFGLFPPLPVEGKKGPPSARGPRGADRKQALVAPGAGRCRVLA